MKIKTVENKKLSLIIFGVIFVVLILLSLVFQKGESTEDYGSKNSIPDTETPTKVLATYNIADMVKNNINMVHSDSIVSIYFNSSFGIPKMYYVYKDSLSYKQITDKFFLHVYPKNEKKLQKTQKYNFVNLDFLAPEPIELIMNGQKLFVFEGDFFSNEFSEFLEIDNIAYFNTGRYLGGQGRSYEASKLKLENLQPANISNSLEKLTISLTQKDFNKIRNRRNEALKSKVLVKQEGDFVKSKVSFKNLDKLKSQTRLKGDWTDHLNDERKWSFRIILDDDKTLLGMNRFSIQHPKVRNYEWEWLFHKTMKMNDIIGLRYDFLNVDLEITEKGEDTKTVPLGIMAIEESFDKRLIENNERREGIILSFDESQIWSDRKKQFDFGLDENARSNSLQSIKNAPIKLFDDTKVLSDPKLAKQFDVAKNLLEGLRAGKLKISEVFDIDKLTMFVALSNLFGGHHGLISHNLKFYFNPITNKLEPISFDTYAGNKITNIINYPFSSGDDLYTEKLLEKLELVSNSSFIEDIMDEFNDELSSLFVNLSTELKTTVDPAILDYNSNFIKKTINPANSVVANLLKLDKNTINLSISNLSVFPVVINSIEHIDGKTLSVPFATKQILYPNEKKSFNFDLKNAFDNAFVSKKNKVGGFRFPKDTKKLRLKHKILGLSSSRKNDLIPFGINEEEFLNKVKNYRTSFITNLNDFDFISVNDNKRQVIFNKGNHQINKTLLIPKNYTIVVEKNFSLDLINGASIISYSPIICNGTKDSPIRFFSSNGSGGGIFVTNTESKSVLNYCYFTGLSNPSTDIWELSGAVNFHEAYVEISHSVFESNLCEDALNIIRSNFLINNSLFENTYSDSFDGDFVKGTITDTKFLNSGNDGIDISGSTVNLKRIVVNNPSDKAISAGESSKINGSDIQVLGGEIGIVSKDLSFISLIKVSIKGTRLGLSSFQKKPEFGNGSINITSLTLLNNELDYLIENGSELIVDNVPVETVSNNVIDQMYGKEYGKSSK